MLNVNEDIQFLVVDLFCGAGGTTTGFERARVNGKKIVKVIACVNHDPIAIKSHWENHPDVIHFEEDIRTLKLQPLVDIVNMYRKLYPNAKLILWASLECTNFSKAKGGQPRDADSRTLALHLFKYIHSLEPDFIQIENVVEFMSWGPMSAFVEKTNDGYQCCNFELKETEVAMIDDDGLYILNEDGTCKFDLLLKPCFKGIPESRDNGKDWVRWCNTVKKIGFQDEWKQLNSANFGSYTSRNRLFGCFAKHGLPIVWPAATHAKNVGRTDLFTNNLKPWKAVKEVLDFTDEGESIFNRKKPLVNATFERIYAGLEKFVAKGDKSFITKYYSGKPSGKNISVDGPAGTIKTIDGQALVQTKFLLKYNSKSKKGVHIPPGIDQPAPVIAAQARLGLVQPEFLSQYYGNGYNSSVSEPSPTLTTKDRCSLVQPQFFIDKHFGSKSQNQSVDEPAGTLLPTDKHRLVQVEPFIMPTSYGNKPSSINEPSPTLLASRRHHYILNPSHGGHTSSVENPCPVIIARQDKSPLYLISILGDAAHIPVYDSDSEIVVKIKHFMAYYGLSDIKMRMLRVPELLRIQGFGDDYKLAGNETQKKKFIGNSVEPTVPKVWIEVFSIALFQNQKLTA
ncbi:MULTISPECIES: DNA cytosine methyltransferase [unclassified Paraflavitalea]|uniref:DNA cytosine methyltransferase n=1 Tax=unclassified Paraflavitalea TaxID=2798305 RepID=UPI003D3393E9